MELIWEAIDWKPIAMAFRPLALALLPCAMESNADAFAFMPIDVVLSLATPMPALVPMAILSLPLTRLPAAASKVAS